MSPRPGRRRCPATPERPRGTAGSGGAEAPRLRRDGTRQLRSAGQLLVPAPGPGSAALLPPPSPPGPRLRAQTVLMLFKERALVKKSGLGSREPPPCPLGEGRGISSVNTVNENIFERTLVLFSLLSSYQSII